MTDFYSGGADGVDCWASLIVLELRKKNPALRLHLILPHEGQADKWSDSAQDRYHSILEQADLIEYMSRKYYDGCMLDRNHRLVEATGVLLAVYNGERRGGTAATVRYARKAGRKVIRACFVTSNRLKDKQYGLKYGRIGARELGKGKEKACSYGGGADV